MADFATMDRAALGDWYAAQVGYNAADDEALSTDDLREFCVQVQAADTQAAALQARFNARQSRRAAGRSL